MGTPFIDDKIVSAAKKMLRDAGLQLVTHDIVIASKAEARECFARFKKMDDVDAVGHRGVGGASDRRDA